jgi:chromosome segregation ATPase
MKKNTDNQTEVCIPQNNVSGHGMTDVKFVLSLVNEIKELSERTGRIKQIEANYNQLEKDLEKFKENYHQIKTEKKNLDLKLTEKDKALEIATSDLTNQRIEKEKVEADLLETNKTIKVVKSDFERQLEEKEAELNRLKYRSFWQRLWDK